MAFTRLLLLSLLVHALSSYAQTGVNEKIVSAEHGMWEPGETKCNEWSPDLSESPANQFFSQSRSCSTQMTRRTKVTYIDSGTIQEHGSQQRDSISSRIETSIQRRNVRGGKDSIVAIRQRKEFSEWRPVAIVGCSPTPVLQRKIEEGTVFFVLTQCQADMERSKEAVEVWLSGKQVPRTDLTTVEKKRGLYTRVETKLGSLESWKDNGLVEGDFILSRMSCDPISINPTWELGKIIAFPTSCRSTYLQKIEHLQISNSGKKRVSHTNTKEKTLETTVFTGVAGQEDFVLKSEEVYTEWVVKPDGKQDCFSHPLVDPTVLNWGQLFTEVFQCTLPQMRKRESVRLYASGHEDRQLIELEFKDMLVTQTKTARGGRDEKISDGARFYTDWTPFSEQECSPWGPREMIIPQGLNFIQTSECYQSRERELFINETWKTGERHTLIGKESDVKKTVSTRMSTGIAAIAFHKISILLQGKDISTENLTIHPMAKRVKIALELENPISESIIVQLNNVQLEIPPGKLKNAVYYYGIEEYQMTLGDNVMKLSGGESAKGRVLISVE